MKRKTVQELILKDYFLAAVMMYFKNCKRL